MGIIRSSTPVLDASGLPAGRRIVFAYRTDTGTLVGRGMTSDGIGDPHWDNVEVLLLARGDDSGVEFGDWSPRKKVFTHSGVPKFSHAQALDESASILFTGVNGEITVNSPGLQPGSGDFTLDGFIYRLGVTASGGSTNNHLWDFRTSAATGYPLVYIQGDPIDNELLYYVGADRISGPSILLNTLYHIEISRVSGVSRMFVQGTKVGPDYTDSGNYTQDQIRIGGRYAAASGSLRSYNGYHGSFRYTKGVGRHTTSFTPPTAFPLFDDALAEGHYQIDTGSYDGECHVVCLDDAAGTVYNHQILRTTPV